MKTGRKKNMKLTTEMELSMEQKLYFFGIIEIMFEELEGYSPMDQEEIMNYVADKLGIKRYA